MKARILKLRNHFPYSDGQTFSNFDGDIRTLKKLSDERWGLADTVGNLYLIKNHAEDILFYIKRNQLNPINNS
jgi:hypothetical protein